MHQLNFKYRKCRSKRKLLIKSQDIVTWHSRCLTIIKHLRSEGKPIFYLDETWVDSNLTFRKCWQSDDVFGICADANAGNRLIIVTAGSRTGFLKDAALIYKAGSTVGDYHGQMNGTNFEKWVREKLLNCLSPNSAVVMDNAPYHNVQVDKVPSQHSVKPEMVLWLMRKDINCDMTMRKETLYELISMNMPLEKIFKIDELLKAHGHTVVSSGGW